MRLADKIYNCRRQKGYSQEQFADLLGVSRQSVSKWETGEAMPDINKLVSIANIFGVTTDWLLSHDEVSVEPKVEASIDFASKSKGYALITSLKKAKLALEGKTGTIIKK